ncbi:MAG: putative inorganic carbon transporter subunit DabA, partial [Nannocystaceae bacterium]
MHHNTLHAFEDHDFEEALAISAGVFGCERYLEETTYLRELERGRIRRADVRAVVRASLGA